MSYCTIEWENETTLCRCLIAVHSPLQDPEWYQMKEQQSAVENLRKTLFSVQKHVTKFYIKELPEGGSVAQTEKVWLTVEITMTHIYCLILSSCVTETSNAMIYVVRQWHALWRDNRAMLQYVELLRAYKKVESRYDWAKTQLMELMRATRADEDLLAQSMSGVIFSPQVYDRLSLTKIDTWFCSAPCQVYTECNQGEYKGEDVQPWQTETVSRWPLLGKVTQNNCRLVSSALPVIPPFCLIKISPPWLYFSDLTSDTWTLALTRWMAIGFFIFQLCSSLTR